MNAYDVIAIHMGTRAVRIIAAGKGDRDAEAIVNMAVVRRGLNEEFFVMVPSGRYAEGATYVGH